MSVFSRNIRQVRIWTPRRHPRRWRSWGQWRRWLYRRRLWQSSSRPVYPARSACSTSAATKDFSSQNCRLIFKWFRCRLIGTQPTKALLIPTVRHWDTPSTYGIQQDRASKFASIRSTKISSLVVKLRRGAGVTRGAGARTCLQSSFLMFCEHYNAKLLLLNKKTILRKTTDFTQK